MPQAAAKRPARWPRSSWNRCAEIVIALDTNPVSDPDLPMSHATSQDRSNALASGRWQLWVDRGGGFDILEGEQFSIGGPGGDDPADIAVRYRWGRRVATLIRSASGDAIRYGADAGAVTGRPLGHDQALIFGSASDPALPRLRYQRPCPLSGSAVVTVTPPHRLFGPIDASILFQQTLLLGPEPFNHVQAPGLSPQGWIMFRRGEQWWIRGTCVSPQPLEIDRRWQYEDWSLMIRQG